MSAPRSGPFAWSPFGDGYLVASTGPTGRPVVDLLLPAPDGALRWVAAFSPDDVDALMSVVAAASSPDEPPAPAPAVQFDAGPSRARSTDRRLTTMGGLALALSIVVVFWVALGVLLWTLLR